MADFYWIGINTNQWGHNSNWMKWDAAAAQMDIPAVSPPQPGDNAIFGRSAHSGTFYNNVDTGAVNVNDIRIMCPQPGNPALPSELLPNGTPSFGFDTQGFTMTVSGVVTCENFAFNTLHTSQIPTGYHVGAHNADEYGGQQVTIIGTQTAWPYTGNNTAHIACTQAFYNNGGAITDCATVCGSYYSSGQGVVGYSGTCRLETSGVMTIENMRGALSGLRVGALILDDGQLATGAGGLTGGAPITPQTQLMEVGALQINGNVTRAAGLGVGPIWRASGLVAAVIAAGVTVNAAHVKIASTMTMSKVLFTPGGILDVEGCALTLPTFLGYGSLSATEGTIISADVTNYHEFYDINISNNTAGAATFGLAKIKVAHNCALSSLVDATYIAAANEIFVNNALVAATSFSQVSSIQLHTAGPVLYPVKNVHIHSALTSYANAHSALLTAHPGSYIEGGTGSVVTEKYLYNGANQHFSLTIKSSASGTPYEATSTHNLVLSLTIDQQDSAKVTTILGNGSAVNNPIGLTVGGSSVAQQKVRLDTCHIISFDVQKRNVPAAGDTRDYIESTGPVWFSGTGLDVLAPTNPAAATVSSVQIELNTVAKPGPVVFINDFTVASDARVTFRIGGAATAMTHQRLTIADSASSATGTTIDILAASDDQTIIVGQRFYLGAFNNLGLAAGVEEDDIVWELTGVWSAAAPSAYATAALYKAVLPAGLTCELADNCQYNNATGNDSLGRFRNWDIVFKFNSATGVAGNYASYYANPANTVKIPGFISAGTDHLAIECVTGKEYGMAGYPPVGNLYQWQISAAKPLAVVQRGNVASAAFTAQGAGQLNENPLNEQYITLNTLMAVGTGQLIFDLPAEADANITLTTTTSWTVTVLQDTQWNSISFTGAGSVTWLGGATITHTFDAIFTAPLIWNAAFTIRHLHPTNATTYGWNSSVGSWTGTHRPTLEAKMNQTTATLIAHSADCGPLYPLITFGPDARVRANSAANVVHYLLGHSLASSSFHHEQPDGANSSLTIKRIGGYVDEEITHLDDGKGSIKLNPYSAITSNLKLWNAVMNQHVSFGYTAAGHASAPCVLDCTHHSIQDFTKGLTLNNADITTATHEAAKLTSTNNVIIAGSSAFLHNQCSTIATASLTIKTSGSMYANTANVTNEIVCTNFLIYQCSDSQGNGNIAINGAGTRHEAPTVIGIGDTSRAITITCDILSSATNFGVGWNHATSSVYPSCDFQLIGSMNVHNMDVGLGSTFTSTIIYFNSGTTSAYRDHNTAIIETLTQNAKDYIIRGQQFNSLNITAGTTLTVDCSTATGIRCTFLSVGGTLSYSGDAQMSLKASSSSQTVISIGGAGVMNFPGDAVSRTNQFLYIDNSGAGANDYAVEVLAGGELDIGNATSDTHVYSGIKADLFQVNAGSTLKLDGCEFYSTTATTGRVWLTSTSGAPTVEISSCKIDVTQQLLMVDHETSGFFIYSGVSATSTDSQSLMFINGGSSEVCTGFKIYSNTFNQAAGDGSGYTLKFLCQPKWDNFYSNRVVTVNHPAIDVWYDVIIGPAACPKNWVFESPSAVFRVSSVGSTPPTNTLHTSGWSIPLATSNMGSLVTDGKVFHQKVNGGRTLMIGGDTTGGSVVTSIQTAQSRITTGYAGSEYIQSQGKTYFQHLTETGVLQSAASQYMVPRTGTIAKVTFTDYSSASPCTFQIGWQNRESQWNWSGHLSSGASFTIPAEAARFKAIVYLTTEESGFTDLKVIDTAHSDAVLFTENFDHNIVAGDNIENASPSTSEHAFASSSSHVGATVFPTSIPPICGLEVKPKNPTYLLTPPRSSLVLNKEFIVTFGYQDINNFYIGKVHVDHNTSGAATVTLWQKEEGVVTQLQTQSVTLPIAEANCSFGWKWTPGVSIEYVNGGDTDLYAVVGSAVATNTFASGQHGFGSQGTTSIRSFDVIERSGLTLRAADISFQSGKYWGSIVNGLDLYDCTVNANLAFAFPTFDTDTDASVFELTSFLTDAWPERIESFCQLSKATLELNADLIISGQGRLHLFGCIVKHATGARWKIDTSGVSYTGLPPLKIASCQLRGMQTTISVEGKAPLVLDDGTKNTYLQRIYSRKEMRVKRNRVLGLEFNRNITQGFDNQEQDVQMIVHDNMEIPGELDQLWKDEKVFEFITPYCYTWKAKLTAYRTSIMDTSNITTQIRFTVEQWRTD